MFFYKIIIIIEKMEELIECHICSERYNTTIKMPKILNCGHTFCKECLNKSLKYTKELSCSICRQITNINDPEQLITNRTIYDLLNNIPSLNEPKNIRETEEVEEIRKIREEKKGKENEELKRGKCGCNVF